MDEITKIASALDQMEGEGINPSGIAILRLLMITGARPSEIEGLKWSEVDLHARCLRLAKASEAAESIGNVVDAAMNPIW